MLNHKSFWHISHRADPRAAALADRHYSRQKPGTPQFVAPGRCIVLLTEQTDALWVSSWQYPKFVKHDWPGAWVCSLFRNESNLLSGKLIRSAVAATRWIWGKPPRQGMITFINPRRVRHKRDFGRCFRKAGFQPEGQTKRGLIVLRLPNQRMPKQQRPAHLQQSSNLTSHIYGD